MFFKMGLLFSLFSYVKGLIGFDEEEDGIESSKEKLISKPENEEPAIEIPKEEEKFLNKADNEETVEIPKEEEMFSRGNKEPKWKKFATMPIQEKRKHYKCGDNFVTVDDIETWTQYFDSQSYYFHSKVSKPERRFPFNKDLNEKVSLWKGDITTLEIDAIVNAANERLLGGGGVDGCIHRAAGPTLVEECRLLNGCETGNTKITSGHKLPAKFVLHTVGPIGKQEEKLESCYKTCLQLCLDNKIRTVAFCCVSTGIYGYPNKDAAEVALRTTRKWLEKNADAVDRIIFCLFLPKDIDIYNSLMLKYFPPREEEDIRESEQKRAKKKKEQGGEDGNQDNEDEPQRPTKKHKHDGITEHFDRNQGENEDIHLGRNSGENVDEDSAVERLLEQIPTPPQVEEDLSKVSSSEENAESIAQISTESKMKEFSKEEESDDPTAKELAKDLSMMLTENDQKELSKEKTSDDNSAEKEKEPITTATDKESVKELVTTSPETVKYPVTPTTDKETVKDPATTATDKETVKDPVTTATHEESVKDPVTTATDKESVKDPVTTATDEETVKDPVTTATDEESVKDPVTSLAMEIEHGIHESEMEVGNTSSEQEKAQVSTPTESELSKTTKENSPMDVTTN